MSDLLQIATLASIAAACGILGPFLVLKRMAMFANALSHTLLLGISVAFLLTGSLLFDATNLLIGAFLSALLTAFLTGGLIRLFRLQEDASTGLVFTSLFAIGIITVTLFTRNAHLGIEAVMGNADILQVSDLKLAFALLLCNLGAILLCFRPLQLTCFDPNLALTLGVRPSYFQFFLLFLTSITCIGAFRAIGVLLVLAFLVVPFLIARLFSPRLIHLLFFSPLIGVAVSVGGVLLSRLSLDLFDLSLSTGGIITTLLGLIYLVAKSFHSAKMTPCGRESPY